MNPADRTWVDTLRTFVLNYAIERGISQERAVFDIRQALNRMLAPQPTPTTPPVVEVLERKAA
jgi:hypothetical protein